MPSKRVFKIRGGQIFIASCLLVIAVTTSFIYWQYQREAVYMRRYQANWAVEYQKDHGPLGPVMALDGLAVLIWIAAVLALIIYPLFLRFDKIYRAKREAARSEAQKKRSREQREYVPAVLPPVRVKSKPQPDWRKIPPLKKGDQIAGRFKIHDVLGRGGFGVVYLVFDAELRKQFALKTFRHELLVNTYARAAFKREATHWVELGEHPYILSARSVVEASHRLFVSMDYVEPDSEGRVTLSHYLRGDLKKPVPLENQIEWGIQFCLGMEHANKRGIACHRDIKPENILITSDGILKISDFGLAVVTEAGANDNGGLPDISPPKNPQDGYLGLSLIKADNRNVCGTPGYIPPEVYRGEGADVRSDIYSFGLVLWQMAAQSPAPPFALHFMQGDLNAFMRAVYETQMAGKAPRVDGPLQEILEKCLDPTPAKRYKDFAALREDLEVMLWRESGKSVRVPREEQKNVDNWYHRGISMKTFGRLDEALAAFDEAIKLAPDDAKSLIAKAAVLSQIGRYIQSLEHYDRVIALKPGDYLVWNSKGVVCLNQAHDELQAFKCFQKAASINPKSQTSHMNAGITLVRLKDFTRAIHYFDNVLALNANHPQAWSEKGFCLIQIKKHADALVCYERAVTLAPKASRVWYNKALTESMLRQYQSAITSYSRFLELASSQDAELVKIAHKRLQQLRKIVASRN